MLYLWNTGTYSRSFWVFKNIYFAVHRSPDVNKPLRFCGIKLLRNFRYNTYAKNGFIKDPVLFKFYNRRHPVIREKQINPTDR